MENKDKIPVIVITGFLGAGNPNLLNHYIREYQDTKFAITENEFGEIGLDRLEALNLLMEVD